MFVTVNLLSENRAPDGAKPLQSGNKTISDHVTFSDAHGHKHRGLVRWIGTDKSVLPDGSTIVGIETVSIQLPILYHHYYCTTLELLFSWTNRSTCSYCNGSLCSNIRYKEILVESYC